MGACHNDRSPFYGTSMPVCGSCACATKSVSLMSKKAGGGMKVKRVRKIKSIYDFEYNYKYIRL